jgi:hypothetical protein
VVVEGRKEGRNEFKSGERKEGREGGRKATADVKHWNEYMIDGRQVTGSPLLNTSIKQEHFVRY